jgi:drug/metabolite transporter (DMT)-like permease
MNFLKCSIALLLMMGTLVAGGAAAWPVHASQETLLWLAGSGLIGLALGDTFYFSALVRLGPRRTLLLAALVPVITSLLGVLLLGEVLTLRRVLGTVLTVGGVVWVISERAPATQNASGNVLDARTLKVGLLFAVLAALCQSSGQLLVKASGNDLSALEVSVVRLATGVVGIAVQLVVLRKVAAVAIPFQKFSTTGLIVIATLLGTYAGVWLMNIGILNAPVGLAATLNSTSPIFILPLAAIFLQERVSARAVVGAVVAVIGIGVLMLQSGT